MYTVILNVLFVIYLTLQIVIVQNYNQENLQQGIRVIIDHITQIIIIL